MRRICSIGTVTEIFPNVIISLIVTLTILKIESWAFNIGRVGRRVGNWFQNLWGNSHLLLQNILRRILVQGRGDLKKLQHKADFTNRCRKFPHIILKLVGLLGRVWESYNPAALWEHWLGGRLPYVVREGGLPFFWKGKNRRLWLCKNNLFKPMMMMLQFLKY